MTSRWVAVSTGKFAIVLRRNRPGNRSETRHGLCDGKGHGSERAAIIVRRNQQANGSEGRQRLCSETGWQLWSGTAVRRDQQGYGSGTEAIVVWRNRQANG